MEMVFRNVCIMEFLGCILIVSKLRRKFDRYNLLIILCEMDKIKMFFRVSFSFLISNNIIELKKFFKV